MNWTQVDIYTTTDGIDLLCSDLMDLGIRGFSIQDAEDFNEFLQNKDGKWDYIDEDLMGLSHCEKLRDHLSAGRCTGCRNAANGTGTVKAEKRQPIPKANLADWKPF